MASAILAEEWCEPRITRASKCTNLYKKQQQQQQQRGHRCFRNGAATTWSSVLQKWSSNHSTTTTTTTTKKHHRKDYRARLILRTPILWQFLRSFQASTSRFGSSCTSLWVVQFGTDYWQFLWLLVSTKYQLFLFFFFFFFFTIKTIRRRNVGIDTANS